MRRDHIDYYLEPPALVDDERAEPPRGSIPLHDAAAVEEPGRPHCIRVGDVLLSCHTRPEQERWLRAIGEAGAGLSTAARGRLTSEEAEEPPLLLIPPEGPRQCLQWHVPTTMLLPLGEVAASVLILDGGGGGGGSGGSAEGSSARALCRLRLPEGASEAALAVEPLLPPHEQGDGGPERRSLRVRVHSSAPAEAVARGLLGRDGVAPALAAALLLGGCQVLGALLAALAAAWLLLVRPRLAPPPPPRRRVVFSAERLEAKLAPLPSVASALSVPPRWIGRWRLDKACSEKYEPILADMGVNYLLRKAADTVKSALIISVSASHVTIHVKTLVSVEDCIPLDGSWTTKPVPPGGRMKGQLRVRLTRISASELEMLSEFPDGEGELRDTLVVHEDGSSFTRTVARGELSVVRVFRRE